MFRQLQLDDSVTSHDICDFRLSSFVLKFRECLVFFKTEELRKKEKDEPQSEDEEVAPEETGVEDDTGHDEPKLLADYQHRLQQDLRQPSRSLLVKDLMICFQPDTIFGQRAGFLKALMVTVPCIRKDYEKLNSLSRNKIRFFESIDLATLPSNPRLAVTRPAIQWAATCFGRAQLGAERW